MEDFVAQSSRWRIARLVLVSAAFVTAGLWMGGAFGPVPASRRYPPAMTFAIGWLSVIFFGCCGAIAIRTLFNIGEQLRIGAAGIRSRPWSDKTIPWSEIRDVTTWTYKRQKAIVLHLGDPARFPGRRVPAIFAGANRWLTGGDVAISLTGTDRSFQDALAAIDHFRR